MYIVSEIYIFLSYILRVFIPSQTALLKGTVIFHRKSAHLKVNNFFLRYALYDVNFESICYRFFPFDEITSLYQ